MVITPPARPTPRQRRSAALRSTVVLKAVMAVSGLVMVLYLLAHMYGNLKVFAGQASFDGYADFLRTVGEPLLPFGGLLWIVRVVLGVAVVAHIFSAVVLWRRSRHATAGGGGGRYESTKARTGVQRSYASFTMRWGGVTLLLFIVFHVLQLSADNVIHPGGASVSPYERVVNGFGIWWVVLVYTVALLALGLHLRHGFWSAFASLGANTSAARRRHLNQVAVGVSLVITIGFLLPPYAILLGWTG
ncbi:MAG: succinate dehydrogenase cytochrome b subunit [Mycobacteriaceae bacterium]